LGGEVEVPTIEGTTMSVEVPAGTESGKVLRVPNKGIPHFSSFGRGTMHIVIDVVIPKKLSKEQKELLERLREEGV